MLSPKPSAHYTSYGSRWCLLVLMGHVLSIISYWSIWSCSARDLPRTLSHTGKNLFYEERKQAIGLTASSCYIWTFVCVLFLFWGSIITLYVIVINGSRVAGRMYLRAQSYDCVTCVPFHRLNTLTSWRKWTSVCKSIVALLKVLPFLFVLFFLFFFKEVYEFILGPNRPQAVWIHIACDWDFHIYLE